MGFFRRLLLFWKKKEHTEETMRQEEQKSFFLYIKEIPQIVTYFRREKGISQKKLELTLVDNEDRPAYQIVEIIELLVKDLNLLYLVTGRRSEFEEVAEDAMENNGLLIVLLEPVFGENMPGNLTLRLHEWEKHLDIVTGVSYNTVHYEDIRPFSGY